MKNIALTKNSHFKNLFDHYLFDIPSNDEVYLEE